MCENGRDGQVGYVAILAMLATLPVTPSAFTLEVKGDSKREGNETFYLDLFGNSSNSRFTKNRGVVTILNDD